MSSSDGNGKLYGGIDLGGTKIYAIIATGAGKIIGSAKRKTKAKLGFDAVVERTAQCLEEACVAANIKMDKLAAVGAGVPSSVSEDGIAVNAPNLKWENASIVKALRKHIPVPIAAENDCNMGTLGEYAFGAGKGAKSLVGFFMGTGLGGGMIRDGELFRGENRLAAELGHIVVQHGGRLCGCGRHGCLEAYASKVGMAGKLAHEVFFKGRKSALLELCEGNFANIKSSDLAKAYLAKDAVTVEAVNEAADYLGIGVATMITIMGPSAIIIGGGVFEALGKELIDRVRKSAKDYTFPPPSFKDTKIALASLGDNAVALGALVYARDTLRQ